MVSIIRFSDLNRWRSVSKWALVYGRRKVGKSFFIRNHAKRIGTTLYVGMEAYLLMMKP